MLKRLAASASLAAALFFPALAPAAPRAQEGKRAPVVPELAPDPLLPPAVSQPDIPFGAPPGTGVGWGMPDETCYKLNQSERDDLFAKEFVAQEAVITERPAPRLTDEARRNGTRGPVRLGVALSKNGKVAAVWVFKGQPHGLTERAVAAACRIKFRPATTSGRPVTSRVMLEYVFAPDR